MEGQKKLFRGGNATYILFVAAAVAVSITLDLLVLDLLVLDLLVLDLLVLDLLVLDLLVLTCSPDRF